MERHVLILGNVKSTKNGIEKGAEFIVWKISKMPLCTETIPLPKHTFEVGYKGYVQTSILYS
jgi:hypothetical protein